MKVTNEVLIKSLKISLVVGTLLTLINHGDVLFGEEVTSKRVVQIVLCFIVTFGVSLYSQTVVARQRRQSDQGQPSRKNTPGS